MKSTARNFALLLACIAIAVFGLASNAVHADGHEQPDWYEEDTPWEDLTPNQQKAKYTSYIDTIGDTIDTLTTRYKANKGKYDTDATALEDAITAIGGAGAPGPLPAAPANPPNLAGLAAFAAAFNTWLAAYNAWYAGLTDEQKAQLGPLKDALQDKYNRLAAIAVAIIDLKEARGQAESGLLAHCTHFDG
ncbi:MAG: hypothetical protein K8I27_12465 [Planctomycetes bacterium]|nr:hypothetical protein [Planctomycetota bacterium]